MTVVKKSNLKLPGDVSCKLQVTVWGCRKVGDLTADGTPDGNGVQSIHFKKGGIRRTT